MKTDNKISWLANLKKIFTKLFPHYNWWHEVKTDKTRTWVLVISVIATLILSSYSTYLYHEHGPLDLLIINSLLALFFCIVSVIIMYRIYDEKNLLTDEAWSKFHQTLTAETAEINQKFYEAYHDTHWIRHVVPIALIIHLVIVCFGSLYIWLSLDYSNFSQYFIALVLIITSIIITIKFINDIYNLLNYYQKAKGLSELI